MVARDGGGLQAPVAALAARDTEGIQSTVWPATAWDDGDWDGNEARGWTVMGRLRDLQQSRWVAESGARLDEPPADGPQLMRSAHSYHSWNRRPAHGGSGGSHVVAMLFSTPDSHAIRTLDADGDVFDVRTGETWHPMPRPARWSPSRNWSYRRLPSRERNQRHRAASVFRYARHLAAERRTGRRISKSFPNA
jgi:hypothetical protein